MTNIFTLLSIIYAEGIISVINAVPIEGQTCFARRHLACVVQVVGALTTGTICIAASLQGHAPCYVEIVVAVAACQVVTGDDGHRFAQFRNVGQSYDKARESHVEAHVSVECRAISLALRTSWLGEEELTARSLDGAPFAHRFAGTVELRNAGDGRKRKAGWQRTIFVACQLTIARREDKTHSS